MIMLPGRLHYARRTAKIRQDKEREKDLEHSLSPLPFCGYNKDTTKGEE
jgi:hypothetical protein